MWPCEHGSIWSFAVFPCLANICDEASCGLVGLPLALSVFGLFSGLGT